MMVLTRRVFLLVGVAALLAVGQPLRAQTALKYQFKQGETLQYALSIAQKSTAKGNDMEFTSVQKQLIDMSWLVQSVDDKGNAKVRLKVDRARLSVDTGKQSWEAASDAKEEPADDPAKSLAAVAKSLAKLQGDFTLTPQGDAKDVSIPASAIKEMKAVPGAEKAAETWTPETLQRTIQDVLLQLPPGPVTKGKTWQTKIVGQSPFGKITGETVHTYDGTVERDGRKVEKIVLTPKLKVEIDPKAPVALKNQEAEGAAYFDNASGRLVEVATSQQFEVQAEVKGSTFMQRIEVSNALKLLKAAK
jgi:hypothetical protein